MKRRSQIKKMNHDCLFSQYMGVSILSLVRIMYPLVLLLYPATKIIEMIAEYSIRVVSSVSSVNRTVQGPMVILLPCLQILSTKLFRENSLLVRVANSQVEATRNFKLSRLIPLLLLILLCCSFTLPQVCQKPSNNTLFAIRESAENLSPFLTNLQGLTARKGTPFRSVRSQKHFKHSALRLALHFPSWTRGSPHILQPAKHPQHAGSGDGHKWPS